MVVVKKAAVEERPVVSSRSGYCWPHVSRSVVGRLVFALRRSGDGSRSRTARVGVGVSGALRQLFVEPRRGRNLGSATTATSTA